MTATSLPIAPARLEPSVLRATAAFTRLEIRRVLSNRRYLMFVAIFPVFFYLLWTNIGLQGDQADAAAYRTFLLVSMATYGAIGGALQVSAPVARERASGWTRQLRVTPLPPVAYLLAKLAASFLTSLPALVLVSAAGILVNHVSLPATTWIELVGLLALAMLPFAAIGVLVGLTIAPESVQIAVMVIYFTLAIAGGLWVPLSLMPDLVASIGQYLPSYRAADLGWTIVSGNPVELADVVWLLAYTMLLAGLVAWAYRRQDVRAGD
jgi:ABC-2 type transport system permease protein